MTRRIVHAAVVERAVVVVERRVAPVGLRVAHERESDHARPPFRRAVRARTAPRGARCGRRGVRRRVDLDDVGAREAAHRAASARTSARSSHAASPPGTEAGQPGATERSHTSTSMSRWMPPPPAPAISSASAATSASAAPPHVVERHDRDAPVGRAPGVGDGVREVGDAELHDAPRVEAVLDQPAHRRAVRDAVAQVEVRVDRDESRRAGALRDRVGRGVVAAERDHEVRARAPAHGRGRGRMPRPRARRARERHRRRRSAAPRRDRSAAGRAASGCSGASASRTAAGVACAPVGESDVRHAGTPRSAASTRPSTSSGAGQSPARGQSGS